MRKVLILAGIGEAATGIALLIDPSLVGRLLLGGELSGIALPTARVAGIALLALGIAVWPRMTLVGMFTYSTLVALYLAHLGLTGAPTGILLWPAVILHLILTAYLWWHLPRMLGELRPAAGHEASRDRS